MPRSKFSLGLLVGCLIAAGLLAFNANPAQSEKGAFWLVNGAKISESLQPTVKVEPSAGESHVKLLGALGALNPVKFHIVCNLASEAAHEVQLLEPNGSFSIKFGRFTGCKFFFLKKDGGIEELKECEPQEGAEKGVILIAPLKGLIVLNGTGAGILSLEPKEGTTFFTVKMSEECAFEEKMSFKGKLQLKDGEGEFSTDRVTHLLEDEPNSTKLFVNNSEASTAHIDFRLRFSLTFSHAQLTWAGHPS